MTMTDLCAELHNYFVREIKRGEFEIVDGKLNVDFIADGQYFCISGSIFNDYNVFKYPDDFLKDEKFSGEIWLMAVPPTVVALADDISKWTEKNADVISSPYNSESFGGYSYTKSSGSSDAGSAGVTWQAQFRTQLNRWRKV